MDAEPPLNSLLAATASALPEAATSMKTSALSSIVEFLGSGSAYLGAWMRRARQGVDDTTEARSIISKALATQLAEELKADTVLVNSLTEQLAPSYVRKQKNKLRVAEEAIITLVINGEGASETTNTETVDLDWLHTFERFAEDASSENMQSLWGRVLAGEISKPGRFTKATLRFLYELDVHIAQDFEQARPHIIDGKLFPHDEAVPLDLTLRLEGAGIVTRAGGNIVTAITLSDVGHSSMSVGHMAAIFMGSSNKEFEIPILPLTKIGLELSELLPNLHTEKKLRDIAASLKGVRNLDAVGIGPVKIVNGLEQVPFQHLEIIWQNDEFNLEKFVANVQKSPAC